jgi:hypothetical protein
MAASREQGVQDGPHRGVLMRMSGGRGERTRGSGRCRAADAGCAVRRVGR